jgi:hypothetical protein
MTTSHTGWIRDYEPLRFFRPKTVKELQAKVREVIGKPGAQIRVRGSQHSDPASVYTDDFDPVTGLESDTNQLNVLLDYINGFEMRDDIVTVGAGMHIGVDPFSRGPAREYENSLVHKLDEIGLALPSLGGISHQSLGGFLCTGSAGGSTRHDLVHAIHHLTLIDGSGELRTITRGTPDFPAAVTSLGLLGIIVEVAFSTDEAKVREPLPKKFDVAMTARTTPLEECRVDGVTFDLFGEGAVASFLQKNEYARILWWPQRGVNLVQLWTGTADRSPESGEKLRRYVSFDSEAQHLAAWFYRHLLPRLSSRFERKIPSKPPSHEEIKRYLDDLKHLTSHQPPEMKNEELLSQLSGQLASVFATGIEATAREPKPHATYEDLLVAGLLNFFLKRPDPDGLYEPWFTALPHDNQINDNVIPVIFTESWIDIDKAHVALRKLKELFDRDGLNATGTMCLEIYAAHNQDGLISPCCGREVVRIDPFVFWVDGKSRQRAIDTIFAKHWAALADLGFRSHWGKVLEPASGDALKRRQEAYGDRLGEFLQTRERFDRERVFLNDYWRRHLGIT